MIRRVKYTKPTIGTSIAAGIIGTAVNAVYIFREMTGTGNIQVIAILSLILGIAGIYLTHKNRKSAAFVMVCASVLPVLLKFPGTESFLPSVWGLCYVTASSNDFQLINIEAPLPESSNDVIGDMLSGKMIEDAMSKQGEWLKRVNGFISRYGVFAYYGYMFAASECFFLHLARLFAPEVWNGYSREFLAFWGGAVLVAVAGLMTEIFRRKYSG